MFSSYFLKGGKERMHFDVPFIFVSGQISKIGTTISGFINVIGSGVDKGGKGGSAPQ